MRKILILALLAILLKATTFSRLCSVQAQPVSERVAGTEQTGMQHIELRQTLSADPGSKDSLVEVRILDVRTYMDTIRAIEQRGDNITIPADPGERRGHYVQTHVGAAIGSVGNGGLKRDYVLPEVQSSQQAALSGVVQLQYAYFFHRNVGIGIGAWLSNYTSYGNLSGEYVSYGLKQRVLQPPCHDPPLEGTSDDPHRRRTRIASVPGLGQAGQDRTVCRPGYRPRVFGI